MISDLISLDLSSDFLTDADLFPAATKKEPMQDMTDLFYSKLFKPIPKSKSGQITFTSSLLIGWQGSGKSDTIAYDVWRCQKYYGKDNVEIIHTNSYKTVLDSISGKRPVVFAIVDDAMKKQNSRRSMSSENAELVADYNETRHVFEKRTNGMIENAVIIVETAVQRWHGLDITMRSSSELIRFKTGETDKKDRETIQDYLGPEGLWNLDRIWNMAQSNAKYKSFSVGRIANLQPPQGVGICWNGFMPELDPSFVLPPLIEGPEGPEKPKEVAKPSWTAEDPLSDVREDPKWKWKILCHGMSVQGIKNDVISKTLDSMYNVKLQPRTVKNYVWAVKKLLEERSQAPPADEKEREDG